MADQEESGHQWLDSVWRAPAGAVVRVTNQTTSGMSLVKIGILTFHRCINYGSYWQARCLADGLRAPGREVVILDHESRRIDLAEWRCAFQPMLPAVTPRSDYPCYREKIRRFFRSFDTLPLSPGFALDAPATMPRCDAVVVGSDEVWNLRHPWYGGRGMFFGEGIAGAGAGAKPAPRLLSYAASFGNCDPASGLERRWADRLRRFQSISVRDEASRRIVERALEVDPPVVLDPCLQFEPDAVADVGTGADIAGGVDAGHGGHGCRCGPPDGRYLALYGHNLSAPLVEQVQRWARHRQLPVVSIGYRNDWADRQWIAAGPHEFARFIGGAEAVVTNFFHGCVFALRSGRPFLAEESAYRSNKLRGLMAIVGGEPHLLARGAPAAACTRRLDEPLAAPIRQRILRLRERSSRYLAAALAAAGAP